MTRVLWIFPALLVPLLAVDNPRMEYALGVHARFHGNADEAARRFESARLADLLSEPLMKIGAERLLKQNDRSGAIQLYRELADARSGDLAVQLSYADFITGLDRDDALARKLAMETLEAVLVRHPGHPQIIRRLISIHIARGEKPRAKELLESLPADDPECALLYASVSRTLHEKDDADARAAVDKRLLQALQSHPVSAVLAREASDHFRNTGRVEQAIDVLKQHTQAAPWSLDLRVRLGILRFSAKHDAEGEVTLKEVLAIDPRRALAHQSLAKFYRQHDRADAAVFHARELLKIRGGSPSEFIKLADETLSAGDPREARLLLEKAVFDHPEDLQLAMKLAIATHRDPETRSRASRLFSEAEAIAPDGKITDPVFLTESDGALIESGQSKAAEERLRAAIRAYPPDAKKETASALRRLAALWKDENRNADAARALLQRADALDPR